MRSRRPAPHAEMPELSSPASRTSRCGRSGPQTALRTAVRAEADVIGALVAELEECSVSFVRCGDAPRVPDRAPILLRPCRHLARVREHAVRVAAERAVDLLDAIQIREFVPIE